MRTMSAWEAKTGKFRSQLAPREGTLIRGYYDAFIQNKGMPVRLSFNNRFIAAQLTDVYGLDIRCLKKGRGGSTWILAGEWFGKTYVDYIRSTSEGILMKEKEIHPPKCPKCGSEKTDAGFGLAGGGYGVYMYCEDCHAIFDKVQEYDEGKEEK